MKISTPLFSKLPIPCALINEDNVITMASEAAIEIGYFVGKKIESDWLDNFNDSKETEGRTEVFRSENWWLVQFKRVERGAVLIATNISKEKALIEALESRNQKQTNLGRQIFHHDAMTFLNGIDFWVEEASDLSPDNKAIKRISSISLELRNLMEGSSYLYGAGKTPRRALVLKELVEHVLKILEPQIKKREAIVTVEGNGTVVWGDTNRLGRVLMNLISNALNYQPLEKSHIPVVKISIKPESDQEFVTLEVKDNGIGVSAEYQEQIFSPLSRLHGSQDYPGSGLGLAIVERIILEHNGSVGVFSEQGDGSKFWIKIPGHQKCSTNRG